MRAPTPQQSTGAACTILSGLSIDLERAITQQDCPDCTAEQACLWAYLCFDLNARPKKCAYPSALGFDNHPAWQLFGHSRLARARREFLWGRYRIQLIFYQDAWGWRLRKGWQEKLEFLKAVYLDKRDWHAVPMPWLKGSPRPDDVVIGGDRSEHPGPFDAVLGGKLH